MSKKGAYWRLYTTQFREEKEQELLGVPQTKRS